LELLALKFDSDGLIPVVIQNALSKKVLMLGYMNEEALQQTLLRKLVVFWSRSRQELWLKGETSGNFLELESIFYDCDLDALLIQAHPKGPTCHTGAESCFANRYASTKVIKNNTAGADGK
jgi:phosphoribosyl-ATP pyrophosphohydrolase/phosphoribosyl-AMP cyclohydrolase